MVLQISYDFVGYTEPAWYERLEQQIQSYSQWMRFQRSEWFIETDQSPEQVHAKLWQVMRPYDRLMVTRIQNQWAVTGMNDEQLNWLRQRNFGTLAEALARILAPVVVPPAQKGIVGAIGSLAKRL